MPTLRQLVRRDLPDDNTGVRGRSGAPIPVIHESAGGSRSQESADWHEPTPQVRSALDYVKRKCEVNRPLIDQSFQTDGRFLFIERLEQLINASKAGQLAMPDLLPQLNRIERDPQGLPLKLFPFTRASDVRVSVSDPKPVDEPAGLLRSPLRWPRCDVNDLESRSARVDSSVNSLAPTAFAPDVIEEAIRCEAA